MKKLLLLIIVIAVAFWWFSPTREHNTTLPSGGVAAEIVGSWHSTDDPKASVVYRNDGTVSNFYDGAELSGGSWELTEGENGSVLIVRDGDTTYEYVVLSVGTDGLVLSYTARGNTLAYTRIDESNQATSAEIPEGWESYASTEGAFTIAFPSEWEVQESLKPQDLKALHEVSIHEKEYDMWRGELKVILYTNDNALSVGDWLNAFIADAEEQESQCKAQSQEPSPCLFFNGLVRNREETTFAGLPAVTLELFAFDHEDLCTYVAHGDYMYRVCSVTGENPNDPNDASHQEITSTMRSTFSFTQ